MQMEALCIDMADEPVCPCPRTRIYVISDILSAVTSTTQRPELSPCLLYSEYHNNIRQGTLIVLSDHQTHFSSCMTF